MKIKHILSALGLALPLAALAVPADPTPRVMTNPDGSTVTVTCRGDDRFCYYADAETGAVIERDAKGYWRPVVRNGRELKAEAADIAVLRNEAYALLPAEMHQGSTRMAALDNGGRTTYPTLGEVHSLVVLLEFADTKFADYTDSPYNVTSVRDEIYNKLNQEGYSNFNGKGSALDYYLLNSDGKFHPKFEVSRIVTLPKESEYYVGRRLQVPSPGRSGKFTEAIEYAIKELDDEIDFSQYDYDDDGKIDNIFFYYAGYGQADSYIDTTIWPHQGDYSLVYMYRAAYPDLTINELIVDGKEMATYACANELKGSPDYASRQPWMDGIGTFCHEYGHVLGYPDFYDPTGGNTEQPDNYDLMAGGSYNNGSTQPPLLNAYERWVCRWLEYEDFIETEDEYYELPSYASSHKAYRLNILNRNGKAFPNEYFLFECRTPDSWDAALPDHGLAVWHVRYNKTAWVTNSVNVDNDPRFRIVRPQNAKNYQFCWKDENSYIYPGNKSSLTPKDVTAYNFICYITEITYDPEKGTASFRYNHIKQQPDVPVEWAGDITADPDERDVYVSWLPVDGAADYKLNAFRRRNTGEVVYWKDPQGREYNEYSMGNVTSFVIKDLNSQEWNNEGYLSVRAVMDVPSASTSTVKNVTPKELPSAAVAEMEQELLMVSAGQGFIDAPAGAEIYDMAGHQVPARGLAPGVYVVRCGANVVKVVVK